MVMQLLLPLLRFRVLRILHHLRRVHTGLIIRNII